MRFNLSGFVFKWVRLGLELGLGLNLNLGLNKSWVFMDLGLECAWVGSEYELGLEGYWVGFY